MEANREYKSTFFAKFFNEPHRLRELYNALADTNYDEDTPLEITTIDQVFFKGKKNDVSFTIDNKFVIILEHQSTINNNMPLRCLLYIARVYEKIIDRRAAFMGKLYKIPAPEFIVLYNGKRPYPSEQVLRLSDAFETDVQKNIFSSLELTVRVVNINPGYNDKLLNKSESLYGYTALNEHIKSEEQKGHTTEEAIESAIKWGLSQRILSKFLEEYGSEVANMLFVEFDADIVKEVEMEEMLEEIEELTLEIAEKKAEIAEKDTEIAEKDTEIKKLTALVAKLQSEK